MFNNLEESKQVESEKCEGSIEDQEEINYLFIWLTWAGLLIACFLKSLNGANFSFHITKTILIFLNEFFSCFGQGSVSACLTARRRLVVRPITMDLLIRENLCNSKWYDTMSFSFGTIKCSMGSLTYF